MLLALLAYVHFWLYLISAVQLDYCVSYCEMRIAEDLQNYA